MLSTMNKAKIYRNGALTPAQYSGEIEEYASRADSLKPVDRAGRCGSLYASPTLLGNLRWVRANLMFPKRGQEVETYEITVDADATWVYNISQWEKFSWHDAPAENYWNSGMLLSEWNERYGEDALNGSDWEVLISPESIVGTPRRVSRKRMLDTNNGKYCDLEHFLRSCKIR